MKKQKTPFGVMYSSKLCLLAYQCIFKCAFHKMLEAKFGLALLRSFCVQTKRYLLTSVTGTRDNYLWIASCVSYFNKQ